MPTTTPWHRGTLAAIDFETTGTDHETDRIVTAAFIKVNTATGAKEIHEWLVNPGIEIPEEASRIHGITTDHAATHGRDPKVVIQEINQHVKEAQADGIPIFGFNVVYDLSLLHHESLRHGETPSTLTRVVDVYVVDRHIDRYRKGGRNLEAVCKVHNVALGGSAHNCTADAMATLRVGWLQVEKHPSVLQIPLDELHSKQKSWKADQSADLQAHLRRSKGDESIVCPPQWPVRLPGDDPDASKSPLLTPPKKPIPAGRYAVRGGDGAVQFYVIDQPTEGKWAGYTFLKRQAGAEHLPVKGAARAQVMTLIEQDPRAAAALYGKELGLCGLCGKELTNPASIESGIGPVCASKF